MSRKGNCYDNAAMESFFGTLKCELFHINRFDSIEALECALHDYIRYYNVERIKSNSPAKALIDQPSRCDAEAQRYRWYQHCTVGTSRTGARW